MNEMVLAQYAKWPQLGFVKTRIAKALGDKRALEIHVQLVTHIMEKFCQDSSMDFELWLSSLSFLDKCDYSNLQAVKLRETVHRYGITCREQKEGDLGQRMAETFRSLSRNYSKVAIIGSDCPNVSRQDLCAVEEGLDSFDVVIIPAEDGGYVLIALKSAVVDRLERDWLVNVPWGTSSVLEDTLEHCKKNKLSVLQLPESWDVDEVEDYNRWASRVV